jgi:hypothetical protein
VASTTVNLKKIKVTTKDIEFDFRETLIKLFYDIPRMNRQTDIRLERIAVPTRYNYQRDQEAQLGKYILFYKGRKFAEIQCKPHKVITLFEQFDQYRLASKILERTALAYIPEAKVEVRYGE